MHGDGACVCPFPRPQPSEAALLLSLTSRVRARPQSQQSSHLKTESARLGENIGTCRPERQRELNTTDTAQPSTLAPPKQGFLHDITT